MRAKTVRISGLKSFPSLSRRVIAVAEAASAASCSAGWVCCINKKWIELVAIGGM